MSYIGRNYYSVTYVYREWPETWTVLKPKVDPSKLEEISENMEAEEMKLISFDLMMSFQKKQDLSLPNLETQSIIHSRYLFIIIKVMPSKTLWYWNQRKVLSHPVSGSTCFRAKGPNPIEQRDDRTGNQFSIPQLIISKSHVVTQPLWFRLNISLFSEKRRNEDSPSYWTSAICWTLYVVKFKYFISSSLDNCMVHIIISPFKRYKKLKLIDVI